MFKYKNDGNVRRKSKQHEPDTKPETRTAAKSQQQETRIQKPQ